MGTFQAASRLRILLLTTSSPIPPTAGDRQRTNLLFHALQRVGGVDLCVFDRDSEAGDCRKELETKYNLVGHARPRRRGEHWPWRLIRWVHPRWIDRFAHNLGRRRTDYRPDPAIARCVQLCLAKHAYDLIVCRYLKTAAKSGILGKGNVVIDLDDVDTHVYASRLSRPGLAWWQRIIIRRHLNQLRRIVGPLVSRAQGVWIASSADRAFVTHPNLEVLPNIPFGSMAAAPPQLRSRGKVILLVGSLSGFAAVAVDRFLSQCWPSIRKARPDAIFRIVGVGMSDESRSRWAAVEGVEPIGYVSELPDAYDQCAFAVSPLFEGAGTKIKVLEPFLYGRTVVVAKPSLRGYEHVLRDGESLMVADDEAKLASACIELLDSAETRDRLAARGLEVVRDNFSFEVFCAAVESMVTKTASQSTAAKTTGNAPYPDPR
jgi:glycosyltransferase involved in cell wall biosynthesis